MRIPGIPTGLSGAELIRTINDRIDRLSRAPSGGSTTIHNTTVVGGGGGSGGAAVVEHDPLSGGTTAISAPSPAAGKLLAVFLQQPSAGGQQVTWGSEFENVTPNDLDRRGNYLTSLLFVGRADGKYWPVSIFSRRSV